MKYLFGFFRIRRVRRDASRRYSRVLLLVSILAILAGGARAQSGLWVTAYYAGWMRDYLTPQNIDYGAVTHIIHFALVPRSDGTLDDAVNSVTAPAASALVAPAHAAGRKVIISVGGWTSDVAFRGATAKTNRSKFISNLVGLMKNRAYDGIDIDWEPLLPTDATGYTEFITELRTSLDSISPKPLLTAAAAWQPSIFAQVKDKFDQVNIMTYDLSGAWQGWVTWHNAPVYDGGNHFPGGGALLPSANAMVDVFIAAGVPAAKLGIGIDFYGYVWSGGTGMPAGGATGPMQSWTVPPSVQANVPYFSLMDTYYQAQYARWDSLAQAAYLSIDNAGSSNDKFISYDNEISCQKKVVYAHSKGIGGVILWELGGGYRANQPAGQRDLLLQAVKNAAQLNQDSRMISFSGYQWLVKRSPSPAVPGPNYFTDDSAAVRVDSAGRLHLKIVKQTGRWLSSEVILNQSLGYGRYVFHVQGRPGNLNENAVLGLFTWDDNPAQFNHEMDLEFSRRGNAGDTMNARFVVQPDTAIGHLAGWRLPPSQDTLTGSFNWQKDSISFLAVRGSSSFPPYGLVNASWKYAAGGIPVQGIEHAHVSLWLYGGRAPSDSQEVEMIISKFEFDPASPPLTPLLAYPQRGVHGVTTYPTLQWNQPLFAQVYTLQLAGDSLFGTVLVNDTSLTQTWKGLSSLGSLSIYYWRVKAKNQVGESPWSEVWPFTTGSGVTQTFTLAGYWNLVSLPLVVTSPTIGALYPLTLTPAFAYAGGAYVSRDTLEHGTGYWLKFSAPQTLSITGQPLTTDTIAVSAGWNLIGSVSQTVAVNSIGSVPPGLATSGFYGYRGSFFIADSIRPGAGYWVKVSEPGSLVLSGAASGMLSGLLRISPTTELPPAPPGGIAGVKGVPSEFVLEPLYPNPFNPSTRIAYQLPVTSRVMLRVYNLLGETVRILRDAVEDPGYRSIEWNASELASGIYICRLDASCLEDPGRTITTMRKVVLLK